VRAGGGFLGHVAIERRHAEAFAANSRSGQS
jgi:hypothetical protein